MLHGGLASGTVADLIGQAVAPFRHDDAMSVEGPFRTLPPGAGYQLILLLHELCTNALKHGALSVPEGRVHISWTGEPHPFRLEWRETGGPPVVPPAHKGLGSRLFAGQSAFAVEVKYEVGGVVGSALLVVPAA